MGVYIHDESALTCSWNTCIQYSETIDYPSVSQFDGISKSPSRATVRVNDTPGKYVKNWLETGIQCSARCSAAYVGLQHRTLA